GFVYECAIERHAREVPRMQAGKSAGTLDVLVHFREDPLEPGVREASLPHRICTPRGLLQRVAFKSEASQPLVQSAVERRAAGCRQTARACAAAQLIRNDSGSD